MDGGGIGQSQTWLLRIVLLLLLRMLLLLLLLWLLVTGIHRLWVAVHLLRREERA